MAESILEEDVFMHIPTPIITDILARLPPKPAIRCSCVCKAWLKLISEPEFVNLHLSKSPTSLIVHKLYSRSRHSDSFSLVEVEDETDHHGMIPIAGTDREIPRSCKNARMSMIGSIDGLVCINEFSTKYDVVGKASLHLSRDLIHVWNPIMGDFITVQTPGGERNYPSVPTYGFGTSSGKYLVVMIFQEIETTDYATNSRRINDSTCYVYTIGDGVWKSIGHAPYLYIYRQHGLFFSGKLHWLIHDQDGPVQISCLDLEKELFQPLPPLPELCEVDVATLSPYNGCLSVCDNTSHLDIVIWVMKEYGVQSSWSKEVVINKHRLINFHRLLHWHDYLGFHIIKVFKDGEILLLWGNGKLFSYHSQRKTVQDIDVKDSMIGPCDENNPRIETREYVSSIVSLKSLGESNINRS